MVVTKTYNVHRHTTKPVVFHRKRSNKRFYALILLVVIATTATTSYCIMYNIGPTNELACLYKQVHNPTYKEMLDFVNIDTTESNEYTDTYTCGNFSTDVILNAKSKGIEAGYVSIRSAPVNHAIVVFKTTDKGIYFLEPQGDNIFAEVQMTAMHENGRFNLKDSYGGLNIPLYDYSINWFSGI
jgi:hypothetical protein